MYWNSVVKLNNRSGKLTWDWPSDTRTMCACGTTLTGAENVNLTKPLRALALVLEKQSGEIPSDEEILEQIHAELAKVAWVLRDGLSITVKDGVVDLNGVILEERESARRSASSPKMSRASKPSRITSSGSNPSPRSSSIPGRTSGLILTRPSR